MSYQDLNSYRQRKGKSFYESEWALLEAPVVLESLYQKQLQRTVYRMGVKKCQEFG